MRNPLRRSRKKVFLGGEGMRLLWKLFPRAAFFEVYVPKREGQTTPELPLIIESTETRLVEPYTKMFYRLFTARDTPLRRILVINVNCHPAVSRRVAANLAITLASEDLTTCLVDLDVMDAGLHEVFHESIEPGMVEYLLKGAKIREIVRQTAIPELKFIPSGRTIMDLDEILSLLGWGETLDRILPRDDVGLIYAGSGKGFDLAELMPEIDGTLLLFSSGARIDRWVRRELKKVRKRSEVVGVVWTNPMEFPLRATIRRSVRRHVEPTGAEGAPVGEARPVFARGLEAAARSRLEAPVHSPAPEPARPLSGGEGSGGPDRDGDEIRASLGVREGEMPVDGTEDSGPAGPESDEGHPVPPDGGGDEVAGSPGMDAGGREPAGGRLLVQGGEAGPRKGPAWLALVGIALAVLLAWMFLEWRGALGPGPEPAAMTSVPASRPTDRGTAMEPATPPPGAPAAAARVERPGAGSEAGASGGTVTGAGAGTAEAALGSGTLPGFRATGGSELPWSLVLGSYRTAEAAERGRDALRRAGFDAQVVPVDLSGGLGLWHRVMVGQYGDEATARTRLDEILAGTRLRDGRVVNAPWAYLTGMYRSREEADVARADLERAGFDPYLLRPPGQEGVFSVHVGAFQSEEQAGPLGERLRAHGVDSELVRRSGTGS